MLRVAFETLGCRSNHADSVDLQALLSERGAMPCSFETDADVYVINTCTVTDEADKSALRVIRKARAKHPTARIVVTGCMAETSPEKLHATGLVDAVVGPGRKQEVLDAILSGGQTALTEMHMPYGSITEPAAEELVSLRRRRKESRERRSISLEDTMPSAITGPGTAIGELPMRARYHLRVQEGCENACTFCIIPASRGSLSSREIEDVLNDLKKLSDAGYEEVVLTGTHLGGFGEDKGGNLLGLLKAIGDRSGMPRIRLSSIDPNDVSFALIDYLAAASAFCEHLHICIQAFSDATLKRMNRRYRLKEVYEIVRYIGEVFPNVCLGSDVIVGFPGETREDLDEGEERFRELGFSYLHVFPYSERAGTPATLLPGSVDVRERKRRAARWRSLSDRSWDDFLGTRVGKSVEMIVERADEGLIYGTSREFAGVRCDWRRPEDPATFIGKRISVQATSVDSGEGVLICVS